MKTATDWARQRALLVDRFSVWRERYPSWSVFGVAEVRGLERKPGEYGSLEERYNVDIELKQLGYDDASRFTGRAWMRFALRTPMLTGGDPRVFRRCYLDEVGADASSSESRTSRLRGKKVQAREVRLPVLCLLLGSRWRKRIATRSRTWRGRPRCCRARER